MKQFFFLCGLPRSGSTVLSSILSQNPSIYASPNSALVELLVNVRNHLRSTEQARAFMQPTQENDVLTHIMEGMYHFTKKPVIIDKSRAWPHPLNIELLTDVLKAPPKFIVLVRDLPSVLTSFIQLIEKNGEGESFIDKALREAGKPITNSERCEFLFSPSGPVYESWYALKMGVETPGAGEFHFIEYDDLVTVPEKVLSDLYDFLELPAYSHDLQHIINQTPEDDDVYKVPGMHAVRSVLQKTSASPVSVLGAELAEKYSRIPHFWRSEPVVKASVSPSNPFNLKLSV